MSSSHMLSPLHTSELHGPYDILSIRSPFPEHTNPNIAKNLPKDVRLKY